MPPPRGRGAPARRLLELLFLVESRRGGASARDLADELGAQVRTVYRDLQQLQACGVPLVSERSGPNSIWKLTAGYRQRVAAPLDLLEACALAVSRDALVPLESTAVGEAARRAITKIRAGLPAELLDRLDRGRPLEIVAAPTSPAGREPIVSDLIDATARHRTIEGRYRSRARGRETPRRIDPYRLFLRDGVLYLAGHCHDRGTVRTFRVDRFRVVRVTASSFSPPAFELGRYLGGSFGVTRGPEIDVRVRLSRRVIELVRERPVHASQRLEAAAAGEELHLRVAVGPELVAWLLSLGADAEVLEPADLRRAVALGHEAGARVHASEGSARAPVAQAAIERRS